MVPIMDIRLRRSPIAARLRRVELSGRCLVPISRSHADSYRVAEAKGLLVQPVKGIFARTAYWECLTAEEQVLHCMRALQLQNPDWVFLGTSAALAQGLPVPEDDLWPIQVAVPSDCRCKETTLPDVLVKQVLDVKDVTVVNRLCIPSA